MDGNSEAPRSTEPTGEISLLREFLIIAAVNAGTIAWLTFPHRLMHTHRAGGEASVLVFGVTLLVLGVGLEILNIIWVRQGRSVARMGVPLLFGFALMAMPPLLHLIGAEQFPYWCAKWIDALALFAVSMVAEVMVFAKARETPAPAE